MRNDVIIDGRAVPGRNLLVVLVVALAMLAATPHPAWAQKKSADKAGKASKDDTGEKALGEDEALYSCGKAKGKVSVSFKPEVELKDLISWAMGFTCKNFVYGSGIGGRSAKVTIIAPKKMTAQQAWRVFLVSLHTMGLTVVPKGNVLKIIEAAQSKKSSLPLYRTGSPAASDQMVRMILRPEHVPVQDLSTALNAMTSKEGMVTALAASGIILVTDYGSHIAKMKSLVKEIDRPIAGERLYMIKVRNADVNELATKLQEILGTKDTKKKAPTKKKPRRGKKSKATTVSTAPGAEVESAIPSKLIADERTSSLIVLGSEAAYLRVHALVTRLDVAVDIEGGGRIHVYYLENADAEELATTLTAVTSGSGSAASSRTSSRNTRNTRNTRTPSKAASAGSAPAFEGQVRVSHDKPSNSLVVVASIKDFLALREVIRKLDMPRRQVFIEAVILEVTVNNSRDFGVSFHGGKDLDDGSLLIGGLQHSNLQSLNVQSIATQSGLIGGAIGPLLTNAEQLLGTSIPSFGLLFQALATNSNVNMLSSPHILTTDNEPAEISVGENIPYQSSLGGYGGSTGTTGTNTGFGFPMQSIQRTDVALTLKITPHINASDMVRLEIDQEVSDIADPDFEGNGPSWSKRTIKTMVVVKDQQSIVIGGLMSDRVTYSESKIPLLGDLPILGYLFKYTQKSNSKTNLLVLLTPYVIKDQMDIEDIVERKVRERAEFTRTFATFQRLEYRPDIDYRRKRGLVEEINATVKIIETEARILKELDKKAEDFPDGPIDYEDHGAAAPSDDVADSSTDDELPGDATTTAAATGKKASN